MIVRDVIICFQKKDGRLNVCQHSNYAYWNMFEDKDYMEYAKARSNLSQHRFIGKILIKSGLI